MGEVYNKFNKGESMMDYELDYKIRTKKYDPTYKIKTYNEAMEFLKKAEYINSSHFDSMDIDEQMPNLSMPWHLKLEHWIDTNSGEYNHFLIVESKPMRKYPEVDQEDDGCLPGDHEEKSEDFWGFLPGKRIYVPWFMYSDDPNYTQRCSYEFVGHKKFDSKSYYEYGDDMKGMSVKSGHKRPTKSGAGMTAKGVAAYRRRNPGSKLKTAVTGKVKKGSKDANRRKSYSARS